MAPSSPNPQNAPLPPLPSMGSAGSSPTPSSSASLAGMISGILPVKSAVDQITQSCKTIAQTGAIPGVEQVLAQIIALANSLVPMAAQNAFAPGGSSPQGPPPPPSGNLSQNPGNTSGANQ